MFAVIESGGKQYRVAPGDVIDVERSPAGGGSKGVEFDRVLLVSTESGVELGSPVVPGARVTATRVDEVRGPKLRVFKMKRRKGYRRSRGHRQDLLRVRIEKIET